MTDHPDNFAASFCARVRRMEVRTRPLSRWDDGYNAALDDVLHVARELSQDQAEPPPICKSCRFWAAVDDEQLDGECRFEAPRVVMADRPGPERQIIPLWPVTHADEWCGKFEPRQA